MRCFTQGRCGNNIRVFNSLIYRSITNGMYLMVPVGVILEFQLFVSYDMSSSRVIARRILGYRFTKALTQTVKLLQLFPTVISFKPLTM